MALPILCLDFDGVIHSYTQPWQGADVIPDPPVPGVFDFILSALDHFTIAIHSSRTSQTGGLAAMQSYVLKGLIDYMGPGLEPEANLTFSRIQWPTEKPPAFLTIDDRVLCFNGNWPDISELKAFKPWNKRQSSTRKLGPPITTGYYWAQPAAGSWQIVHFQHPHTVRVFEEEGVRSVQAFTWGPKLELPGGFPA